MSLRQSTATIGADGVAPLPRERGLRPTIALWWLALLVGIALLGAAVAGVSPAPWLNDSRLALLGAIVVSTTYTVALAARMGGRPLVFGGLTLVYGIVVMGTAWPVLRTGAAVMTVVIAGVFGVMNTVPAVRFVDAVREVVIAVATGCLGALAALGYAPVVSAERFRYATLGLALILVFLIVYRLGAGFHGLGRRGLVLVLVGSVALAISIAYGELFRRYGSPAAVDAVLAGAHRLWELIGALPRPLMAALGVPALAWGAHMRARRRQGWWISAFGVAGTASPGYLLVRPLVSMAEVGLQVLYSVLVGLVVGYVVIRLDLFFSHTRGSRARRTEEESALRPEPRRSEPLR